MAIRHVVTRGYGNGTFTGNIAEVVARGYIDTGAVVGIITGTAIDGGVLESEIVTGGETIIITLANDTWAAAGTGPIGSTAVTQAIIDGITSAGVEATGWNAEVRDKEVTTAVVRTSDTVATITLTAAPAYSIIADETIEITIPAAALVTSAIDVTGTPTFDVTNETADTGIDVAFFEETRRKLRKYQREAEKKRKRRLKADEDAKREAARELSDIYEFVVNGVTPAVAEQAADIIRSVAKSEAIIPETETIDFNALAGRADLLSRLATLMQELANAEMANDIEEDLLLLAVI